MPMPRRWTGTSLDLLAVEADGPSSGMTNPAMARSNVVLPEPEGPSRPKNSPSAKVMVTPSSAATAP